MATGSRSQGVPDETLTSTVESKCVGTECRRQKSPKDPYTQGPCSDRCLREATQVRCESVLAGPTPGPVMRRQGKSAMSADRSIIHRRGNGRVVSADHATLGQERSSSCQTQSNRTRLTSSCRKGGWRQPREPHRQGNAHTGMCG